MKKKLKLSLGEQIVRLEELSVEYHEIIGSGNPDGTLSSSTPTPTFRIPTLSPTLRPTFKLPTYKPTYSPIKITPTGGVATFTVPF